MSTNETYIYIADIVEVRNNGMDARIINDFVNDAPLLNICGDDLLVGQIGSYVLIRQKPINILAVVCKTWEKDHFDSAGGRHTDRFMGLAAMGDILENGSFLRGTRNYPTPGAKVSTVGMEQINAIFVKFQHFNFFVGQLASNKKYHLSLDPQAFFSRHFAIVGQSGAGKSWTVTNIIQRAIKAMPKSHIILLDLHGEYCWKARDGSLHSAFPAEAVNAVDAQDLEIPYWLMTYAELVDLFIDRSDAGASMQMSFLSDVLQQLKRTEAKRLNLPSYSIDTPLYFPLAQLYAMFKAANEERKDFGKIAGPMFGMFDEFLVKMQSRLNDVRYDFLLRPKKRNSSESMSDLLRQFVGLGAKKANITVVDLSSVPSDVRPSIAAQVGRLAYEFCYWNPKRREFPMTLICEEAHVYIPREKGGPYDGSKKMMERIAKEGRKYGISIGVVSQRPNELSDTMLAQCSSFVCLRTTNPDDQNYIRGLVPESEGNLADVLSAMGRGEALILGDAVPIPTRVQLYKPDPEPKSNDVDYFNAWREGPNDLNVEAIVHLWRAQMRR